MRTSSTSRTRRDGPRNCPGAITKDLDGWTKEALALKTERLASIINKMNDGRGPDIMGVAEVENKNVLQNLVRKLNRKSYSIIHADCQDHRGIDVAFIYDAGLLRARADEVFNHVVMRRNATRDIVQVNFHANCLRDKGRAAHHDVIVFLGNHWPSRTAGVYESEPYRIMAAETLAYFHERIYQNLTDAVPVVAMGDFNDNPFNRSLTEYALSSNCPEKIKKAKNKYFYNMMWRFLAEGKGTYYHSGYDVLDQFLVSGNVFDKGSPVTVDEAQCRIIDFPELRDTAGHPRRFGKKLVNGGKGNGYSDHFPIAMILEIT